VEIKLKLLNPEGMHARPAGILVKKIAPYASKIEIEFNGKRANAKSLLSIMSLGLIQNAEFTVHAEGADAEQALQSVSTLVQNLFKD
jgi:phosphocarrier protein